MNDELWRVQLSTGEIRMMTIEALDEAFEQGLIDARVPVLPPGASAWTTLGEAAGLEDDCPTEQAPSLAPFAIASESSSSSVMPSAPELPSTDELDLPDSFDELQPRRGRGLVAGAAAGALALAAAVAVFAGNLGSSPPADVDARATAVEAPPPPAAVEALPPPAAPAAKEAEPAKPELSDWQKRIVVEADKAREEKARPKTQERAQKQPLPKPKPAKSNTGLLNGGDRFDPLNGAL